MLGTILKRRGPNGKSIFGENDLKACAKLEKIYTQLKNVEFKQSTVSMKESNNVALYFGDSKSITFKDLSGKSYACTYYEALSKLVEDMKAEEKKLETVSAALFAKKDRTNANQAYAALNLRDQRVVRETLNQTSKVIAILGNLMKCVMADLKEIETAIGTITSKQNIKSDAKEVKAAAKEAAEANKPTNKK